MRVIELTDVTKSFGKGDSAVTALSSISLKVDQGEFLAIVGPSGSGKSTLMNILGLLDVPTSGEYKLDEQPVNTRSQHDLAKLRRVKIGFVFQSFNLLPRLNVIQNIMLPMVYARLASRKRKPKALELLKRMGVDERAHYRLNQISGGQTQRVAVARALANDPSLILADEPTGNLDTQSSQVVIDKLKELNNNGVTIIIVTHNPEIAAQTDRIIEIRDGKIVGQKGTITESKVKNKKMVQL